MSHSKYQGSCYCGNISFVFLSSKQSSELIPRKCDCDFCLKHGILYIADNHGKLRLTIENQKELGKYKQGSNVADFYFCKVCGVLTHVTFTQKDMEYGAINSNCLHNANDLGNATTVSPKTLGPKEKVQRWEKLWISDIAYT